PPPDLRCVSVLGPDEISLSWIGLEPDQLEGFVAYYIDRQVGVDWVRVATISDPAQSTFTETGLPNAYENPYCYRMSSARICPEFIEGPSGEEVCSVVATATYFSEVQSTIDWNKYQGWENPVYTLFATDPAAGTIVDTDITDSSYLFKACEFNGRLRVQTIDPLSGCEVFSGFTDTVVHQNMFPSLSDLCRITVEEGNAGIRLNWQSFGADDFGAYLIYRRAEDEENFTLLTTVTDEGQLTYLDTSATVNQQVYCYKIVVEDLCEAQVESGVHCSMKLEADLLQDQYAAEMKWTPYTGWSVGVNRYELWDNNNTTEAGRRVATFSPGEFDYRDEDIRDEQAVYCYQVRAFKDGSGCGVESRSNEQCIIFPPRIFVPSAFSPNGDGHNDEFMVSSIFIRSMELRVFSRWGQEIFFTNSPGRGWDGTFNGKPVPEGVYTYLLRVDSFDRPSFQRGGTITLIR
ncbi:MAG: gliding motility-associated C-terminal domain-containing protein, partial [Bacteroidota bacterium]